ncbi:MAG: glycoside hydrolase family 15 protein [Actinomycetota bacterium]
MGSKKRYSRATRLARYAGTAVVVLAVVAAIGPSGYVPPEAPSYPEPVPLRNAGLIGEPGHTYAVPPDRVDGASYLPRSSVLVLPDGRLRYLPSGSSRPDTVPPDDARALAAAERSRVWLRMGTVPGKTGIERRIAARALLDLRLLTLPNGAALAAPDTGWDYVWPRDASFVAAAFAASGHHRESLRVLSFIASVQEPDGTWEARYEPVGAPVLDGRPPQLDATGWFPWAVWFWYATAPPMERHRARDLWPAVRAAADAAATSLGPEGLPPGGPDYWEIPTLRPNLGTAAPLRAGLRAAADLAARFGDAERAELYGWSASRLDAAIEREFAPHDYPRTTAPDSGADSAITFLAPPFAPPGADVRRAAVRAAERLEAPNGGILPGERWPQDPTVSWTPETALFLLAEIGLGREKAAERRFAWLVLHRTKLGAFPEKIDGEGRPQSAAPLAWTSAVVVLALAEKEGRLPVPPEP